MIYREWLPCPELALPQDPACSLGLADLHLGLDLSQEVDCVGGVFSSWQLSILKVHSYKVEQKSEQAQAPHYFHSFSKQSPLAPDISQLRCLIKPFPNFS